MNWIKNNLEFLVVVALPLGSVLATIVTAAYGV